MTKKQKEDILIALREYCIEAHTFNSCKDRLANHLDTKRPRINPESPEDWGFVSEMFAGLQQRMTAVKHAESTAIAAVMDGMHYSFRHATDVVRENASGLIDFLDDAY